MHQIDPGPGLKRSDNIFQALMYGIGLILGAGIYVLIGATTRIVSLTGLSYAELSSVFPKSAAEYVFVKEGIRTNFVTLFIRCLTIL